MVGTLAAAATTTAAAGADFPLSRPLNDRRVSPIKYSRALRRDYYYTTRHT